MHNHSFNLGVYTAIITPFTAAGKIDTQAFEKLIHLHINAGVAGIVLLGTTSEWVTLSQEECIWIVQTAVDLAGDKLEVVVGIGSSATAQTIDNGKRYANLGVRSFMVVTPFYNTPSQAGMYEHFAAVAQAIAPAPVMLYNVPHRTGVDLLPTTTMKLSQISNIYAIKEASGASGRCQELIALRNASGKQDFRIFSGDDLNFKHYLQAGADGLVSVVGNLIPELLHHFYIKLTQNHVTVDNDPDWQSIFDLTMALQPLSNPTGIKYIMSKAGLIENNLRLPLLPFQSVTSKEQAIADNIMNILQHISIKYNFQEATK